MHARVFVEEISRLIQPAGSNIEFECRFDLDWTKPNARFRYGQSDIIRVAKRIVGHFSETKKCQIEQTINLVCQNEKGGSKVKQLVFVDGVQDRSKQNHYSKIPITNPVYAMGANNLPGYKMQCSLETPIKPFDAEKCPTRVRLRFSVDLDDWRLDLTLVKDVDLSTEGLSALQTAKREMFEQITVKNFVEKAKWDYSNRIECELEYVGNLEDLTLDKVAAGIDLIPFADESGKISDYQKIIYQAAKKITPARAEKFRRHWGVKQLGVQPIELNKVTFLAEILPTIQNFYLTDKVDGQRAIILVKNGKVNAITDVLEELKLPDDKITDTYIFDTERYEDSFYLFDVMVWENESLVEKNFADRFVYFKSAAKLFPFLKTKTFVSLTSPGFGKQIKDHHTAQVSLEYETDGYIFTENSPYNRMRTFKFKPAKKSSVDFLIKKCPEKMLHLFETPELGKEKPDTYLYILCCGIAKNVMKRLQMKPLRGLFDDALMDAPYVPIQFAPSNNHRAYLWHSAEELDGMIGEFRVKNYRDHHLDYEWELMRKREDRLVEVDRGNYFGNNYRIAEMVWMNYQDPINIKFIVELDEKKDDENFSGYFQVHDSQKHKGTRHFNSFVKSEILSKVGPKNVLDIASGKGQDLFRYANGGAKSVVFTDIDKLALMELIGRKHTFANQRNVRPSSMHIQCQLLDMGDPPKENEELLARALDLPSFDSVFCQFAMHYFLKTASSAAKVAKFVSRFLPAGGKFVFTAFDGASIFEKLRDQEDWTIKDNVDGEILYSIRKKYDEPMLRPFGQIIEVWLPFSKGYYPEFLVNISAIQTEFAKKNLTLKESWSFGEMLSQYETANKKGFDEMSEEEKEYSSLYKVFIFEKGVSGGKRQRKSRYKIVRA
jgi:SAM-dependent methyltransferase